MSVPKSMQRIVTVPSGRGMSQRMNARKGEISGMFEVRVYAMDFFRLSKINRPSSTPVTMEAKLSSSSIMSAACLDTSEPAIPMATPMSAFFKAGESFTPSPGIDNSTSVFIFVSLGYRMFRIVFSTDIELLINMFIIFIQ